MSMSAAMEPSSSSVVAALRDLGRWKLGTPLEMASTPVSAAQPEEKARRMRKAPARPVSPRSQSASTAIWYAPHVTYLRSVSVAATISAASIEA